MIEPQTARLDDTRHDFTALPAAQFSYEELAAIYNQTRIDYIVPMPMNAKRMEEYVQFYDVDLTQSVIALNADGQIAAIGMLGRRGPCGWITRLGVIPERRGHGIGQFVVDCLLASARSAGMGTVQLEVIAGNIPAQQLFLKRGFTPWRDLLVVRRPPSPLEPPPAEVTPLDADGIDACLCSRTDAPSWIDATPSLQRAGTLYGLRVALADGAVGWAVFRAATFQITHLALGGDPAHAPLTLALLAHMHTRWPLFDTKVENIPADSPRWPAFVQLGYVEAFRRHEMLLRL